MATTVPTTPTFRPPSIRLSTNSFKSPKLLCVSFRNRQTCPKFSLTHSLHSSKKLSHRLLKFSPFASHGETTETEELEEVQESNIQDDLDGAVAVEDGASEEESANEPSPAIIALLQSYKEALVSNNESKVVEIEGFLISIEEEKTDLERKVATLSEEMLYEKERILRISADFDNFRKRTDRERLSLVTNAQGEVVENLLPVLDNFERAKLQIKVETEGEEKISNSYQSIYKQFVEILVSLGVVPVETIGKPFDPMLHEAIMREDSTEFEEGVIIQEFRKGFKLGDRLLRPSMVKVSAGPGPAKPELVGPSEEPEGVREISEEGSGGESAGDP